MAVYIINYKPDEPVKRAKRNKIHQEQIKWYLEHTDLPIEIVAMNYIQSDYINHPRITYFTHKERALANEVRALYFKERFYKQESPWAIFADDDTYLYSESWEKHCDGATFIRDICKDPNKFNDTPIIWPGKPNEHPYYHKIEPELYKNYFVFDRTKLAKISFCFVRKRSDIVFWEGSKERYAGEELQFCYDNYIAGIPSYTCYNIGKKHDDSNNRGWIELVDNVETEKNDLFEFEVTDSVTSRGLNNSNKNLDQKYKKLDFYTDGKKHNLGKLEQYILAHPKNIRIKK